jgi:tetratricopeptide (TPR) repeat protein
MFFSGVEVPFQLPKINITPKIGQKILWIMPLAAEQEWIQQRNWQVRELWFKECFPKESAIVDLYSFYEDWEVKMQERYDLVVMHYSMGKIPDLSEFLFKLTGLMKPNGKIWFKFKNASYYQKKLAMQSREILPWPEVLPDGNHYTLDEFKSIILCNQLAIKEVYAHRDPVWNKLKETPIGWLSTLDSKIAVPTEDVMRDLFCTSVFEVLAEKVLVTDSSINEMEQTISAANINATIEEALKQSDLEKAAMLLEGLYADAIADDYTHNLAGIYHFYKGDHQKAYIAFIDAITENQLNIDYYHNLYDVASQTGQLDSVKNLMEKSIHLVPGLSSKYQELFGGEAC